MSRDEDLGADRDPEGSEPTTPGVEPTPADAPGDELTPADAPGDADAPEDAVPEGDPAGDDPDAPSAATPAPGRAARRRATRDETDEATETAPRRRGAAARAADGGEGGGRRERRAKDDDGEERTRRTGPIQFLREVRSELRKVAWPNRRELLSYTVVVLTFSLVLTLVVWGFDTTIRNAIINTLG